MTGENEEQFVPVTAIQEFLSKNGFGKASKALTKQIKSVRGYLVENSQETQNSLCYAL